MGHYKSNLRDIEFNLFEVLGRGDVLGSGPYEDIDADTAREMLKEVSRLAENELAESFQDGDRNPPVYDPQTQAVTMPESFRRSFDAYRDSGFWAIDLHAELGGTVAPAEPALGRQRDAARLQPGRRDVRGVLRLRQAALRARQRRPEEARALDRREGLALHDGADRAGCRVRRRRRPHQGDRRTTTAPGPSAASSASSPAPSPTWSTTSCTSCSPAPRAPAPAPRACRSSSSPSTPSTSRPVSSASATASTSPTSRRRWA